MAILPISARNERSYFGKRQKPEQMSLSVLGIICAVLSVFTNGLMLKAGVTELWLGNFVTVGLCWAIVILSGALSYILFSNAPLKGNYCFCVSAGIIVSSIAVLVISEMFRVSATLSFMIWGCLVLLCALVRWVKFSINLGENGIEAITSILCCCLFVTLWCWHPLGSVAQMGQSGSVSSWTDCFIHATTILGFGNFKSIHHGSFELIDSATTLYHYGSYMLPAAALPLADISGLQAVAALHIPIGLVSLFAGVYSIAREMADQKLARIGAFSSVFLLGMLPDTSTYGLANGWFGVRWMLFASPGSSYAITSVLVSLSLAIFWLNTRNKAALFGSLFFAAFTFQMRVHMLMWYLPALAAFLVVSMPQCQKLLKYKWQFVMAGIVAILLALPLASITKYLWLVHGEMEPMAYSGVYPKLVYYFGTILPAPFGFILLFPGMLGCFALLYPVFLIAARTTATLKKEDLFPILLCISAAGVILFAPESRVGDPYEFKHRAFVLLYVIMLIWTVKLAGGYFLKRLGYRATVAGVSGTTAGLVLLATVNPGSFFNADKAIFYAGLQYVDTAISTDLIANADFVRRHAKPEDVAIVYPLDPNGRAAEDATRFASISNVPLFLSRITMWPEKLVRERLHLVEGIASSADYHSAKSLMRNHGFRWLVINGTPLFDPKSVQPTFKRGDWSVYDCQ